MNVEIRPTTIRDTAQVADVLAEAAAWLAERGVPMWRGDELTAEHVADDVRAGLFFVAEVDVGIAGVVKFQLEDPLFWPDVPAGESAYVHRLAVRRAFGGGGVSGALLLWAADRGRAYGRRFLRLDCEASRPRLRAVYERFGFCHHSDRQVGPYFVSRYEQSLQPAAALAGIQSAGDVHGGGPVALRGTGFPAD